MSNMAKHCEEDIANISQSTRIAYFQNKPFWGDIFGGGPIKKTGFTDYILQILG